MVKQHLKQLYSPRTWPLGKKTATFVTRPRPGAHTLRMQVPLVVALRDMIRVCDTKKEVKFLLQSKKCLVDGKPAYDVKRPVGFMDVISLVDADEHYHILIDKKNRLYPLKIESGEASRKIVRVVNKTTLKGGVMQLNTLDGRCVRVQDASKYSVGDSLVLSVPDQGISEKLSLEEKATVLLVGGSHVGEIGMVEIIEGGVVTVKTDALTFRTKKEYAVVVGKEKPVLRVSA